MGNEENQCRIQDKAATQSGSCAGPPDGGWVRAPTATTVEPRPSRHKGSNKKGLSLHNPPRGGQTQGL